MAVRFVARTRGHSHVHLRRDAVADEKNRAITHQKVRSPLVIAPEVVDVCLWVIGRVHFFGQAPGVTQSQTRGKLVVATSSAADVIVLDFGFVEYRIPDGLTEIRATLTSQECPRGTVEDNRSR